MAEIRTVTTLRRKREEIILAVRLYEQKLAQARADLAHVTAAILIFEASGDPKHMGRYVDTHRLFRRGETWAICEEALRKQEAMTTRELAIEVMRVKSLDVGDKVLAKVIGQQLIHTLRTRAKTGRLVMIGKKQAAAVWKLPLERGLL